MGLPQNRRFAGRWNTNNGFRGSVATVCWNFGSGDVMKTGYAVGEKQNGK
jgi:hypothetical protein